MPSSSRQPSSLAHQRPPSPAVVVAATDCSGRAWQIVDVSRRPCHPATAQAFAVPPPSPSRRRTSFRCHSVLHLGLVVDAAADDAPHANIVTMVPSPLVRNHVKT